jgi:hypothetical protein
MAILLQSVEVYPWVQHLQFWPYVRPRGVSDAGEGLWRSGHQIKVRIVTRGEAATSPAWKLPSCYFVPVKRQLSAS